MYAKQRTLDPLLSIYYAQNGTYQTKFLMEHGSVRALDIPVYYNRPNEENHKSTYRPRALHDTPQPDDGTRSQKSLNKIPTPNTHKAASCAVNYFIYLTVLIKERK